MVQRPSYNKTRLRVSLFPNHQRVMTDFKFDILRLLIKNGGKMDAGVLMGKLAENVEFPGEKYKAKLEIAADLNIMQFPEHGFVKKHTPARIEAGSPVA